MRLQPKAAETLALAVHELATNAVKYGGLSAEDGRVAVAWSIEPADGQDRLLIRWTETGVKLTGDEPLRQGFGTELIQRAIAYELEGEASLAFGRDGLSCSISLPADSRTLLMERPQRRGEPRAARSTRPCGFIRTQVKGEVNSPAGTRLLIARITSVERV